MIIIKKNKIQFHIDFKILILLTNWNTKDFQHIEEINIFHMDHLIIKENNTRNNRNIMARILRVNIL